MRNEVLIIRETIFKMEKPFSLKQLFAELKIYEITDKKLIFKVLNELLDSGLVSLFDTCDKLKRLILNLIYKQVKKNFNVNIVMIKNQKEL